MQDFISSVTRLQLPQGTPPTTASVVLNQCDVCLSNQRIVPNSQVLTMLSDNGVDFILRSFLI